MIVNVIVHCRYNHAHLESEPVPFASNAGHRVAAAAHQGKAKANQPEKHGEDDDQFFETAHGHLGVSPFALRLDNTAWPRNRYRSE